MYTRVCTMNLCNDWDGLASSSSGGSGGSGSSGGNSGSGGEGEGGVSGGGGSGVGDPGYDDILYVKGGGSRPRTQRGGLYATLVIIITLMKLLS